MGLRMVQLEGIYKDQVQVPGRLRANQKLNHPIEGIVQTSLEH